jgi:FkbM family methyltransferase
MSVIQTKSHELRFEDVLRQIEAESPEAVRRREQGAFDEIAGPFSERLVLFGAGPLGEHVLAGLREAKLEPLAFSDNNEKLWGRAVSALKVISPAEAMGRYGDTACFVVTIYQGSSVRRQLASLGCPRVAPFVPLMWKYADIFIPQSGIEFPHKLSAEWDAIRHCYSILADDASRRELCEQLLWRYWLDYSALSPPLDGRDTYFPMDLLSPSPEEVFVDCGSFQGEALSSFAFHWHDRFRYIFALEPDSLSRKTLEIAANKMGLLERITILPYAVGRESCLVPFESTGTVTSHVMRDGHRRPSVECRRLDEIEWPFVPTYIKMDIEGAEPEALLGATDLLRSHYPVLAVCTYHRSEHLWEIPALIRSIAPDYNLYLRRYAEECWEGVCYAVPSRRLKRA